MTRPGRVVVVGSINRDYVCRVAELPRPGQTLLGGEVTVGNGGKGANQAVAAALMGVPTAMVGAVGDDDDGRALLDGLHTAGADISTVRLGDTRTGTAFVFVADDGENSIVVAPGANGTVSPEYVHETLEELLDPACVVVVQAEIPIDAITRAASTASAHEARLVVNLAPFTDLGEGALTTADPLVVNETEASQLLGRPVRGVDDARAAAAALLDVARTAVVTVGAAGAVLATPAADGSADVVHLPTTAVAAVVDTTGAGDCFTGVLAAALSRGADLPAAVALGLEAGTHAVTKLGAQASFPRVSDLDPTTRAVLGPPW